VIAAMLRTLMVLLVCLGIVAALAYAGIHGLRKQDAWRCAHGMTEACSTSR